MAVSYFLELGVVTERTQRIYELAHETGALLYGDFTLTSGKKSDHYYDGKQLNLHPEGAYLVGEEILEMLAGVNVDAVGGLAIGAVPIVTAVTLVSHKVGKPIPSFIVREEQKEHGTKKKIEGHFKKGFKVVIVDDGLVSAVVYEFNLAATTQLAFDSQSNRSDLFWSLTGPRGFEVDLRYFSQNDYQNKVLPLPAGTYRLTVVNGQQN